MPTEPSLILPRRRCLQTLLAAPAVLALPSAFAQAGGPVVGQAAPDFTGRGADGRSVSLAGLRGSVVVLEWTNHDCPFVKKHYDSGNMQKIQADATKAGVKWLQVISSAPGEQGHVDGPTALQLNTQRQAAVTAALLDPQGQIGRLYAAKTTPHFFVIDAGGKLVYAGAVDSIASARKDDIAKAEPLARRAIEEVLAGKPVTVSSSKPYGCSVKYSSAA